MVLNSQFPKYLYNFKLFNIYTIIFLALKMGLNAVCVGDLLMQE